MDILRPSLVWIGNRCYRKNTINQEEETAYTEDDAYFETDCTYEDEACDGGLNLVETDDGYMLSMYVPSAFHKHIIGRKAETKKRLETETRTTISVPKSGQDGDVVIRGRDRGGVVSAHTRIDILVDAARAKTPFTHFLSIPVANAVFQDRLLTFKDDVLSTCSECAGIDGSIFQNELKLHFTLGTMVLVDDAEIEEARQILERTNIRNILGDDPLEVTFRGLEYMNDDPGMVDVLYAKVDQGLDRLQALADKLVEEFVSARIMKQQYERVKLHVTVINSLKRRETSPKPANSQHSNARQAFDARQILQLFGDYDFGNDTINEVHISQLHTTHPTTGFYTPAATRHLL